MDGGSGPIRSPRKMRASSEAARTDVDAACFTMDVRDLHHLIGEIVRPANRRVNVKDSDYFRDWLHVIADPIVVKVNAGNSSMEREASKRSICLELRRHHGLALTLSGQDMVLAKSQVNIPLQAMVKSLRAAGHVECRVGFFGMKWALQEAQPKLDQYIEYHVALHGTAAVERRNQFDIGVSFPATTVNLFGFGEAQLSPRHRFRKGKIHEMFNVIGHGAVEFYLPSCEGIGKIKIYHECTHEVMSSIPKENLDDMPKTVRTMHTRLKQLEELLKAWESYDEATLNECILGTRIEISVVNVHKIADAHRKCLNLGLLHIHGIERLLGGPFRLQHMSMQTILIDFRSKVEVLHGLVCGRNGDKPSIVMRSALTRARQALGWSGKNMRHHLQEARKWGGTVANEQEARGSSLFAYDGWQMDPPHRRPLIQDFLNNAFWQNHSRAREKDPHPIMLQKVRGGGFWKAQGIYVDRVTGARHFTIKYGRNWRRFVRPRNPDVGAAVQMPDCQRVDCQHELSECEHELSECQHELSEWRWGT